MTNEKKSLVIVSALRLSSLVIVFHAKRIACYHLSSNTLVIARHRTFHAKRFACHRSSPLFIHAKRFALYPRALRVSLVIISALTRLSSLVTALYPREAYRSLSARYARTACYHLSSNTLVIACYRSSPHFPREAYRLLSLVTALSTRSVSLVIACYRLLSLVTALYPRALRVPLLMLYEVVADLKKVHALTKPESIEPSSIETLMTH